MFSLIEKTKKIKKDLGFSIIELLVVIAIISLITGTVLFRHNTFSGGVALENLAYETALAIRQAQFFGINVRSTIIGGGETGFDSAYGVHFDVNNTTNFVTFIDLNGNFSYDAPDETLDTYTLVRGNKIIGLCVDEICSTPDVTNFENLDILFLRPDPDAIIKTTSPILCGSGEEIECGMAYIYIGSPSEDVPDKVISVGMTGFISVGTGSIE